MYNYPVFEFYLASYLKKQNNIYTSPPFHHLFFPSFCFIIFLFVVYLY